MSFKSLAKLYWNRRGKSYDKAPGHTEFEYVWERLIFEVVKKFNVRPSRALDAGCGTGFLAKILQRYGLHVICLDIAEGMLQQAKMKLRRSSLVDFVQGDCERTPIRDKTMDIVVSRHVLWTLERPHIAIVRWLQTLKTGGLVIVFDGKWQPRSRRLRVLQLIFTTWNLLKNRTDVLLGLKYNILRSRYRDNIDIVENILSKSRIFYRTYNLTRVRNLLRLVSRQLRIWRSQYYMIVVRKSSIRG